MSFGAGGGGAIRGLRSPLRPHLHDTRCGVFRLVRRFSGRRISELLSERVVSAGGTSISRNFGPRATSFQRTRGKMPAAVSVSLSRVLPFRMWNNAQHIRNAAGGTPDLAFDANPNTGVWVFDSNPVLGTGWFVVGGTSVSSPSLAGIVNAAGSFAASSQAENQVLYKEKESDFNDITYGNCGLSMSNFARINYDLCTGVGSPRGLNGK